MMTINITNKEAGQRLDVFLTKKLQAKYTKLTISRSFIQQYIPKGVYIGSNVLKPSYKMHSGDVLNVDTDVLSVMLEDLIRSNNCFANILPNNKRI